MKRSVLPLLLLPLLPLSAGAIPLPERAPQSVAVDEVRARRERGEKAEIDRGGAVQAAALTPCVGGTAGGYPCNNIDLAAFMNFTALGSSGAEANDCWGWKDVRDGHEYALVGLTTGTAFVDITDPLNPVRIGNLPTHTSSSIWRDIKVYNDHAFIVSEASNHGMQVFDLKQLQGVASPPVTFSETAHYSGFGSAHNIVINEDTGFAYGVGTNQCAGGLAFVNIQNPLAPVNAGCFSSDGYTHDAQVVTYHGPDAAYVGHEIAFAFNEDTVTIVDVTNKAAPAQLARKGYSGSAYTHQGWVTEDHRYLLHDDELDEQSFGHNTLTRIWDIQDLNNPVLIGQYAGATSAIDHNLYVKGNFVYEANYRAGLRILDGSGIASGNLNEVAFFDVYPSSNSASFNGAWNVFPWFDSGTVIVTGIEQGLFVLLPALATGTGSISGQVTLSGAPDNSGASVIVTGVGSDVTDAAGNYTITGVPAGSFDVTASKAGYVSQSQTGVPVADGQNVTGVDFTLSPPTGSISGRAVLCDGASPLGIAVSTNTGASTTTDGAGNYTLAGLFDGNYTVTASMPGYLDQVDAPVVVSGGGGTGGVDFQLPTASVATPQICPNQSIPDNNPTGTTSSLNVVASFVPDEIRVNVEISHTWVGDVELILEHPDGTLITLLDQPSGGSGSCSDNNMDVTFDDTAAIVANDTCGGGNPWFSGPGRPVQPLLPLTTKNCSGTWKLRAIDHVGSDTGTIDCWSLELVSSDPCLLGTDAPVIVSSVDALGMPRPNPFDTSTEVAFSVARPQVASVRVYDAAGRLVRTLWDGPAEAGGHSVKWDGRDRSGQRVSGGVYFVRLVRSEGPTETRKVTRLR